MDNSSDTKRMRFKVYVRLRPAPGDIPNGVVQPEHRVMYLKDEAKGNTSEFVFDRVFDADTKQEPVFQDVALPLIEHTLQGYNACCFAYGQTGSGKTYSMFGKEGLTFHSHDNEMRGVIPRACSLLWKAASQVNSSGGGTQLKLFVSFMEIYCDQIRDLGAAAQAHLKKSDGGAVGTTFSLASNLDGSAPSLKPGQSQQSQLRDAADYVKGNLDVMEDASGMTFVKDLTYVEVKSLDDMLAVLRAGYAVRSVASTPGNDVSTRSHSVFTVSVVQYRDGQQPVTGRLNLVDLAGSERHLAQARGNAADGGLRARETKTINTSLAALGKVIMTLSQQNTTGGADGAPGGGSGGGPLPPPPTTQAQAHVSFRDSKLTRVLKDSLTGNSFTALLACLWPTPDNYEECASTLQFAVRCSNIATAPHVNVVSAGGGAEGMVEDLMMQVATLKEELEATHSHYQKLLESVAGPLWRMDPGPVERAPGAGADGPLGPRPPGPSAAVVGFGGVIGASSAVSGGGGGGGLTIGVGGGLGNFGMGAGGNITSPTVADEWQRPLFGLPASTRTADPRTPGGNVGGGGRLPRDSQSAGGKVSVLEAQVRKLESQLVASKQLAAQYEERLTARKEEMDSVREKMAGKEHAQFKEIKKLRAEVLELSKALEAEKTDAANKVEDTKRRGDEEAARLMKDIDMLRTQLAQVTGSVGSLMEKHSAAVAVEKRQREAARRQGEQVVRQLAARNADEHRAQVDNLKQQSTYFLGRQADQLVEARQALEALRGQAVAERDALQAELDYLASYAERVTEVVRRMEAGCVPVVDRGNGLKAFRLPHRERPPRLDAERLRQLKARCSDAADRLLALSAAASAGPGHGGAGGLTLAAQQHAINGHGLSASSASLGSGPSISAPSASAGLPGASGASFSGGGLGGAPASPRGAWGPPSGADLEALRAQWEAELKAQVTAQVLGDMRSDKTVEYIRGLESQVARYRVELQSEKKRTADMSVALRSVQRSTCRPDSPLYKAMAAGTPAGVLGRSPTWGSAAGLGPGGGRPNTAGSLGMSWSGGGSSVGRVRPGTSYSMLTSGFADGLLSP